MIVGNQMDPYRYLTQRGTSQSESNIDCTIKIGFSEIEMTLKVGSLKLKWLKITARAVKLCSYMRVLYNEMGVRGLVSVNLVDPDMKYVENHFICGI